MARSEKESGGTRLNSVLIIFPKDVASYLECHLKLTVSGYACIDHEYLSTGWTNKAKSLTKEPDVIRMILWTGIHFQEEGQTQIQKVLRSDDMLCYGAQKVALLVVKMTRVSKVRGLVMKCKN